MNRTLIDINILQTIPPSNVNRDDTGSPKTAIYGGTRRARVSSQAWKRATRLQFPAVLNEKNLGVRTKRVVELVADRITKKQSDIDGQQAQELAALALKAGGIKLSKPRKATADNPLPDEAGYLIFLSERQVDQIAALCLEAHGTDDAAAFFKESDIKKRTKLALDSEHSIDIALFGRMVADATDLKVDASCQVAHALSVHAVDNEFDYFTAVDDHKAADDEEDAGAGMIGTIEFNSSTLYRYATIDVDALNKNLGDAVATQRAVEAFVQAFTTSMPTGKQNTFANRTLPNAVVVSVRDSQPVNLAGAFEQAITADNRIAAASERLAQESSDIDGAFGTTPVASWVVRAGDATASLDKLGTRASLTNTIAELGEIVAKRLQGQS